MRHVELTIRVRKTRKGLPWRVSIIPKEGMAHDILFEPRAKEELYPGYHREWRIVFHRQVAYALLKMAEKEEAVSVNPNKTSLL